MKTYERDDKIYAVPLGFLVPAVQGEESLVNAAESLKTLAEEISSIREENPDIGRVMIPTDSANASGNFLSSGEYRHEKRGWTSG